MTFLVTRSATGIESAINLNQVIYFKPEHERVRFRFGGTSCIGNEAYPGLEIKSVLAAFKEAGIEILPLTHFARYCSTIVKLEPVYVVAHQICEMTSAQSQGSTLKLGPDEVGLIRGQLKMEVKQSVSDICSLLKKSKLARPVPVIVEVAEAMRAEA